MKRQNSEKSVTERPAQSVLSDSEALALLSEAVEKRAVIFAKILARNDSSWADDSGKHQSGLYIPAHIRTKFFPVLKRRSDKPHIFETDIETFWPQADETRTSRLVHYSNKGPETHFTRIPKQVFVGLNPASLMVAWKEPKRSPNEIYVCLTFDSAGEAYESALDILELGPQFTAGLIEPTTSSDLLRKLLDELLSAIAAGKLRSLIAASRLPSTEAMAQAARERYLRTANRLDLNPFELPEPGNAVVDLIDNEFAEFRRLELRLRVAQIAESLLKHGIDKGKPRAVVAALIAGFDELLTIFKSIRGSRSTRAGTSFELHLRQLLLDGRIPHEYQPVLEQRSPDFVLPTLTFFNSTTRANDDALILTAKTSTRERWMQILSEGRKRDLWFLASLDRTISDGVLDSLAKAGVMLVVPERHKSSSAPVITEYAKHSNVISFRTFFDHHIAPRRVIWSGLT
jgi:hypothetical protein